MKFVSKLEILKLVLPRLCHKKEDLLKKVKVVVIGFGHLGRFHVQKAIALESASLVAIIERTPEGQERVAQAHPDVKCYSDYQGILDEFDAAIVVTPTSTHYEIVIDLIKNKKHVFCEKPLSSTLEQSIEIEKLQKENNTTLQVGHSERCHQAFEMLDQFKNVIYKPGMVKINRVAPFKGRATDVDVVQDLMIHDIDLLSFIFKETPIKVKSSGYKMRTDKYDYVCSNFLFESGREAIISVGRNHVDEVRELEVINEAGCLKIDLFRNKVIFADSNADEKDGFVKSFDYEKRDHLYIEQESFYRSILNNTQTMVTALDGKKAVSIVATVLKSIESKQFEDIIL